MFFSLRVVAAWASLLCVVALAPGLAFGGGILRGGAVGGIFIDPQGVVSTPDKGDAEQLLAVWQSGLNPVPRDLQAYAERRYVSLRGLESQVAEAARLQVPLGDAVRYMAGLLRVEYVLIYPPSEERPQGDVVLAGPAEGWKVDALGNTVGATTNRPVLMLEDLIVAIRSSDQANGGGISCSIDPTPEGLVRVRQAGRALRRAAGPVAKARLLEQALGQQVISVSNVPATSHFARTLVAADFRMKRLAMRFEPAPIDGLPSYLELIRHLRNVPKNVQPRWWLTTNYEPLKTDGDGLAWQIRGQGVKCMTEESIVNADGKLTRTGKAGPFAQKWAAMLTERFDELADHDSAFGHLRNAFDLAIVAAVLGRERALERVKLEAPQITGAYKLEEYHAPKHVASQASFIDNGPSSWIITASGGVQTYPWEIADNSEVDAGVSRVRDDAVAVAGAGSNWWWQ
ncbi:MAG: DUF1598 domain-containing protein [Planctomycetota bacterium]